MTPLPFLTAVGKLANETYSEFGLFQPDRSRSGLRRRYTNEHSEFVQVNGAEIHYREEGPKDAQTLVALHGSYSSLHTWDGWVEYLGDDFHIVRLDMPGHGLTGPRPSGRHTLQALVESVVAFCDELGIEEAAFTGNSLGGGVAWRLAIDRPDLVTKLIPINAGGATLLSTLSKSLVSFGTNVVPRYFTPRMIIRLLVLDAYYDSSKVTDSLVRRYHDLLLHPGNRRAVVDIASNYMQDHFDDEQYELAASSVPALPSSGNPRPRVWDGYDISDVEAPTLFQWGAEDEWLPVSFGREFAARVKNSQFVTYEEVGHVAMEEAPQVTAADAAAFLRK